MTSTIGFFDAGTTTEGIIVDVHDLRIKKYVSDERHIHDGRERVGISLLLQQL